MKTEELRRLDFEELDERLRGARRELYELRFKLAVGQLENPHQIRRARKDIAQILTVVHERRLNATGEEGIPASEERGEVAPAEEEPVASSAEAPDEEAEDDE